MGLFGTTGFDESKLQKTYDNMQTKVIDPVNKQITYENIKTAVKIYAALFLAFSAGFLAVGKSLALFGLTTSSLLVFPAIAFVGFSLASYAKDKIKNQAVKRVLRDFVEKIKSLEIESKLEKLVVASVSFLGFNRGFPWSLAPLELPPFDVFKDVCQQNI